MQGNPVALTFEDHGAKPVGTNRVDRLDNC